MYNKTNAQIEQMLLRGKPYLDIAVDCKTTMSQVRYIAKRMQDAQDREQEQYVQEQVQYAKEQYERPTFVETAVGVAAAGLTGYALGRLIHSVK
jgi:hypothetical protein